MAKQDDHGDDGPALLGRAPNAAIAGLWVSMLEAAGIPAHVPGAYLADDWAASQRVFGNIGADVFVPRDRIDEARRVIEKQTFAADDPESADDADVTTNDEPKQVPPPSTI